MQLHQFQKTDGALLSVDLVDKLYIATICNKKQPRSHLNIFNCMTDSVAAVPVSSLKTP